MIWHNCIVDFLPFSAEDDDVNDEDPKVIFRGIVRVAYMMFTAVLLINVLIAAFK